MKIILTWIVELNGGYKTFSNWAKTAARTGVGKPFAPHAHLARAKSCAPQTLLLAQPGTSGATTDHHALR